MSKPGIDSPAFLCYNTKMDRIDFHGVPLEEALEKTHVIVGKTRLLNLSVEYRFITGNGIIKSHLIQTLKSYGIEAREELGNTGVIKAVIE